VAEGAVGSSAIVEVEPPGERCVALVTAAVDGADGDPCDVSQWLCVFVLSRWWDERMDTIMKRRRHTPEQAVRKIREGERLLNERQELAEVLRHLEITESTFNRWRAQYGGMKADEAKRLKGLVVENQRLKKLVAEQALDIDMLKELAEGNF
jgi:putative transposase